MKKIATVTLVAASISWSLFGLSLIVSAWMDLYWYKFITDPTSRLTVPLALFIQSAIITLVGGIFWLIDLNKQIKERSTRW